MKFKRTDFSDEIWDDVEIKRRKKLLTYAIISSFRTTKITFEKALFKIMRRNKKVLN